MSFLLLFRNPVVLAGLNVTTLLGVGGGTYLLRSHMMELSEDHEARMVSNNVHIKTVSLEMMLDLGEAKHGSKDSFLHADIDPDGARPWCRKLPVQLSYTLAVDPADVRCQDELEGTLRGHIGLIEEALDRLEGKATEADRGHKMNEYYAKRGRDGTKKPGS